MLKRSHETKSKNPAVEKYTDSIAITSCVSVLVLRRFNVSKNAHLDIDIIELLSTTAAMTPDFGPVVVLTVRGDEGSWRSINLGIRKKQAHRLRKRLDRLLDTIDELKEDTAEGREGDAPGR
jgi:hypothetical protein